VTCCFGGHPHGLWGGEFCFLLLLGEEGGTGGGGGGGGDTAGEGGEGWFACVIGVVGWFGRGRGRGRGGEGGRGVDEGGRVPVGR